MKVIAALLLISLAVMGCSYMTDFAVVNRLDSAASLSISLFKTEPCTLRDSWDVVATAPAAQLEPGIFRRSQPEWVQVKHELMAFDESGCILTITLPPHTALRIARSLNAAPESGEVEPIAVQSVSIRWWPRGEAQISTSELMASFRKARPNLYAIYPEPAG